MAVAISFRATFLHTFGVLVNQVCKMLAFMAVTMGLRAIILHTFGVFGLFEPQGELGTKSRRKPCISNLQKQCQGHL